MHIKTLGVAVAATSVLALAACGSSEADSAQADTEPVTWYPITATVWPEPGFEADSSETDYSPLIKDEVTEEWKICAAFPHLADAYWLAADYGVIQQARDMGVDMTVVEAGGYENLSQQIAQIENCAQDSDAVIIGAISTEGLNPTIERLKSQGKVVIDFINGVSSPDITAQSLISYSEIATRTAEYLVEASEGEDVTVGWLPGPKGAGFAEEANKGFTAALEGTNVTVVNTQWGNTDKQTQTTLVEDILAANPDVDFIAGNAVTAEAAGPVLRDMGLTDQIGVLSYYMTPGTYDGIEAGSVLASAADPAVLTARIATDLAVRALEGKDLHVHVAPPLEVIDKAQLDSWDSTTTLAPDSWDTEFRS